MGPAQRALNTNRWVSTVTPIAADPAVQEAFGRYLTDQLMTAIDPKEFFESVLPDRGQILAVPLTNALRGFVQDKTTEFLGSGAFQKLWVEINTRAHTRLVDVLEGETRQVPGVEVQGDNVVLNVIPVLSAILERIGEQSPELFGHTVNLPTISGEDAEEAIQKLSNALGRPLPDNFGQFTVFDAARLHQVQGRGRPVQHAGRGGGDPGGRAVRAHPVDHAPPPPHPDPAVLRHRARHRGDTPVGVAVPGRRARPRQAREPGGGQGDLGRLRVQPAGRVGLDPGHRRGGGRGGHPHRALPVGHKGRSGVATGARVVVAFGRAAVTHEVDDPAAQWVAAHREVVQGGAIAVGILALLLFDLSWLAILLLGLLVVLVVVGAQRIAGRGAGRRGAREGELPEAEVPAEAPPASPA